MKRIFPAMPLFALIGSAVLLLSTGCASIVSGTRQNISVDSNPGGARVFYNGAEKGVTPVAFQVGRKGDKHEIRIEKEGYQPVEKTLERGMNNWMWGNILLGGLIGIAVDIADGAVWDIYPDKLQFTLAPATFLPQTPSSTPIQESQPSRPPSSHSDEETAPQPTQTPVSPPPPASPPSFTAPSTEPDAVFTLDYLRRQHEAGLLTDAEYEVLSSSLRDSTGEQPPRQP